MTVDSPVRLNEHAVDRACRRLDQWAFGPLFGPVTWFFLAHQLDKTRHYIVPPTRRHADTGRSSQTCQLRDGHACMSSEHFGCERTRPRPDDAQTATFICRDEDEVRQKARDLGLITQWASQPKRASRQGLGAGLPGLTRCELTAQREVLPTISEGWPGNPTLQRGRLVASGWVRLATNSPFRFSCRRPFGSITPFTVWRPVIGRQPLSA